ncbi:MAG: phosphatidylserine decarboxylase family protein [Acidobacteria bacterium]|nr:phosphatidylserine decarboxylase family protein [Acidobacteriota bacterium]
MSGVTNSELTSLALGLGLSVAIATTLAWRWQLALLRSAAIAFFCGCAAGAASFAAGPFLRAGKPAQTLWVAGASLAAWAAILLIEFYRDPEREPPGVPGAILSPADGQVIYIRRARESFLPVSDKHGRQYTLHELTRTSLQQQEATVVGIAMSFSDVHVNRSPIDGRVTLYRHFSGRFGSLRNHTNVFENERATTVIQNGNLEIAVVQIASRLVRQIAGFVARGELVQAGQRIGVIRLGSQVDLVMPVRPDLLLVAKEGDRVTAGVSMIAVCEGASARRQMQTTVAERAADG